MFSSWAWRGTLRVTLWLRRRQRGGGVRSLMGVMNPLLHVTEWMRKRLGSSVAAKGATFPWTREMVGPNPPPPPLHACILKSPPRHHLHPSVVLATLPSSIVLRYLHDDVYPC